jgi:hypothetical protein
MNQVCKALCPINKEKLHWIYGPSEEEKPEHVFSRYTVVFYNLTTIPLSRTFLGCKVQLNTTLYYDAQMTV